MREFHFRCTIISHFNYAIDIGDRMKDRGMSWTIKGAQHMGKAMVANGELSKWCGNNPPESGRQGLSFDVFDSQYSTLNTPHSKR